VYLTQIIEEVFAVNSDESGKATVTVKRVEETVNG